MKALTELKVQICREKSIAALRTMGHAGQALQNSAETIDRGSPEDREVGICLLFVAYQKQRKKGLPERLLATVDTPEEPASCCKYALLRAFFVTRVKLFSNT